MDSVNSKEKQSGQWVHPLKSSSSYLTGLLMNNTLCQNENVNN